MNFIKKAFIFCIFAGILFNGFAGGKRDIEERDVKTPSGWEETFDISEKKAGKWNVFVEAHDAGKNVQIAGPFNIRIDPNSDLPIVGITNPLESQAIFGNLNIVGTCSDDDAVASVELILDGDVDNPVKADGKEFWSYYLEVKNLEEGPHTIEAYGIDINGVRGKSMKIEWNLNKNHPHTQIENFELGQLVSGRVTLRGVVQDGNGIESLSYSFDAGETFEIARLKRDKKTGDAHFSVNINTKDLPDGSAVCWFKAQDKYGLSGVYSWLFFVDNTKPEVAIIYPGDDQPVNGTFSAAGFVRDVVGLESVEWELGNVDKGTFSIEPGNPYWVGNFDIRGYKGKKIDLVVRAKDSAGNVSSVRKKLIVDSEADKPVVTLQSPVDGNLIDNKLYLRGIARDDDGVSSILYSLNNDEPREISTDGVFYTPLVFSEESFAKSNKFLLKVWAKDINGVEGNPVVVALENPGTAPVFGKTTVVHSKAQQADYHYGMNINPESGALINLSLDSNAGLETVEWRYSYREAIPVKIRSGQKNVALSIPVNASPWGFTLLEVKAVDVVGRTTIERLVFFIDDLTKENYGYKASDYANLPSDNRLRIESVAGQAYSAGMGIILPQNATSENKITIDFVAEGKSISSLVARVNDETIRASLQKTDDPLVQRVQLSLPKTSAGLMQFSLNALIDKTETVSTAGAIYVLRNPPEAGVNNNAVVYWQPDGTVQEIRQRSYVMTSSELLRGYTNFNLPMTVKSIETNNPENAEALTVRVDDKVLTIGAEREGLYSNLVIVLADSEGNEYRTEPLDLQVYSGQPSITIREPQEYAWVQNSITVKGNASDSIGLSSVLWSVNGGEKWNSATVADDGSFSFEAPLSALEDGLVAFDIKAVSSTGAEAIARTAYIKDTVAPVISVIVPPEGDIVNGETTFALKVDDVGKVVSGRFVGRTEGSAEKPVVIEDEVLELTPLVAHKTGTLERPLRDNMEYEFVDAAGNKGIINSYNFTIDSASDLPVAEIDVPASGDVIQADFEVSGVVYDDDAVAKAWARIDDGEYFEISGVSSSFSFPVTIDSLTDNEHSIYVYGEDIYGVKGEPAISKILVSKTEPVGFLTEPPLGVTVNGLISLKGTANDANGIKIVQVSVDNGVTFSDTEVFIPEGGDDTNVEWVYTFDTRIMQDGAHVVIVRVVDNYNIKGLFSSLLNIDNAAPEIELELPRDGSKTSGKVLISGQTIDNIGIKKLSISVKMLDGSSTVIPDDLKLVELVPSEIVTHELDLSPLADGLYNIELLAEDDGGNICRASRNIEKDVTYEETSVDILYPLNGKYVQGNFNLYGRTVSADPVVKVVLYVDKKYSTETIVLPSGYFKFNITSEHISDGHHEIEVQAQTEHGKFVQSRIQTIEYQSWGPWVTIDNFVMGDFALDRPWIRGSAGYIFNKEDEFLLSEKKISDFDKDRLKGMDIDRIEVSFDNGQTFDVVSHNESWKYRVETEDMKEGFHYMMVRARMKNGETAITRSIVRLDKTPPTLKVLTPEIGGRYNGELKFSGLSSDDIDLEKVKLVLRQGDKASYEVPGFVQGLYIDLHALGATTYDVGLGLSFFDNNVKLQFQIGQLTFTQFSIFSNTDRLFRYGGLVMGGKILANVGILPFRKMFGPDWAWLSASFALGANFSYFTQTQSGKAQFLSAVLAQIEFPRVYIKQWKLFKTFSFYTEGQLWFIPTDVKSDTSNKIKSVIPQIAIGIRFNVF